MWSPRYQFTIVAAIVAVTLASIGSVLGIGIYNPPGVSTPIITSIFGFAATIIVSLFSLLRSEKNAEQLEKSSKESKEQIEQLEKTLTPAEHIVELVIEKEHNLDTLPKNHKELTNLIKEIVQETCEGEALTKMRTDLEGVQGVVAQASRDLTIIKRKLLQ